MPEIHPMAIAILRHLFSKDILVYGFALWPDGNFMSTDAFSEVASEMGKKYDEDYVNLGFKPGGSCNQRDRTQILEQCTLLIC